MDWHPGTSNPFLIATGDVTGKVTLVSLFDKSLGVVKEFTPTYSRQCNTIAWNPLNPNQVAVGLDKIRNDNSVLIWDITHTQANTTTSPAYSRQSSYQPYFRSSRIADPPPSKLPRKRSSSGNVWDGPQSIGSSSDMNKEPVAVEGGGSLGRNTSGGGAVKPWKELANSEASVALAWVPGSATKFATGTSVKWLRIYDTRAMKGKKHAPLSVAAHHKGVHGVVFDRNTDDCLATFSEEGVIKVWDIRHLHKPTFEILTSSKAITQIGWSPIRRGLLAAISNDQKFVSVWDIRNAALNASANEVSLDDGKTGNASTLLKTRVVEDHSDSEDLDHFDKQKKAEIISVKMTKPDRKRYTAKTPAAFAWRPQSTTFGVKEHAKEKPTEVANHMLVAYHNGQLSEFMLQDPLPLTYSPAGALTFSSNRFLYQHSVLAQDPSCAIYARARLGYGVDAVENCSLVEAVLSNTETVYEYLARQSNAPPVRRGFNVRGNPTAVPLLATDLSRFGTIVMGSEAAFYCAALGNPNSLEELNRNERRLRSVLDMWRWIQRASKQFPPDKPPGLMDAGIRSVLSRPTAGQDETKRDSRHKKGFELHRNRRRTLALRLCGWGDFPDGGNAIIAECVARGQLRRAAALAVFDCNLRRAVEILQSASAALRESAEDEDAQKRANYEADLLDLVSMGFAGFPSESSRMAEAAQLWCDSCVQLREKLSRFPFLRAACGFLVAVFKLKSCMVDETDDSESSSKFLKSHGSLEKGTIEDSPGQKQKQKKTIAKEDKEDGAEMESERSRKGKAADSVKRMAAEALNELVECVTKETSISLCDRMAFACRFLPDKQLGAFLSEEMSAAVESGSLEGIVLTGFGKLGIELLQAYVDTTGDVQTAALVSAHIIETELEVVDFQRLNKWVSAYRELLNVWQLWHIRGQLDVKIADRRRLRNTIREEAAEGVEETQQEQNILSPTAKEPQVTVICHHCKQSLLLSNLLGDSSAVGRSGRISRKKNNLPCCPQCRRRLPSCALCTLPMNCFNPYAQMMGFSQKDRAKHNRNMDGFSRHVRSRQYGKEREVQMQREREHSASSSKKGQAEKEQVNPFSTGQPFGQWFSWCLRCRHGGHAACLMQWFRGHSRCPVSECNCQCIELDYYHDHTSVDDGQQTSRSVDD